MRDGLDPILQKKEQQQLKSQLLWRLGVASALIAIILTGISWLEKAQKELEPKEPPPRIAPEIASDPAKIAAELPAITETPTIAPVASTASTIEPASPTPQLTASPSASPSPTPSPSANPTPTSMVTATAIMATSTPKAATSKNELPKLQKINNVPKAAPQATPTLPPKSIKLEPNPTKETKAIPPANRFSAMFEPDLPKATYTPIPAINNTAIKPASNFPAPVSNSRGFSVQAGVFLLSNNAEKLLGQLQQAGIPAYLETRVQIGPFKNKAEADAAVKKLKAMGITPVVKTE
ncbi:SPOR domain-containing protein [Chitinibacter sp. S2-10]|uniref:SPOR domain-containing protein n=1 Tax=Chitinibacter sp. S2-10 TaxID=3373597 RepID=UPI0039773EB3